MAFRQRLAKFRRDSLLHSRVFVLWRLQAIREQRVYAAKALPLGEDRRISEKLRGVALVIALKIDHRLPARARDQSFDDFAGIRTAIDVVPEQDLHDVLDRI